MAKKNLLIVDDKKLFLEMERSFLERDDYSIHTAASGKEAIKVIQTVRPELVMLDHHLPDINGDEICRMIKNDAGLSTTKIIIVTGDDSTATADLYAGLGCDAILNKPFTKSELNAAVEKALAINTRKCPRVNTNIPCILRVDSNGYVSRILNISLLGVYVEIDPLPEIGKQVQVEVAVPPTDAPASLECIVKWTSEMVQRNIPNGVGVEFLSLPDDVKELIIDYVNAQLKDS